MGDQREYIFVCNQGQICRKHQHAASGVYLGNDGCTLQGGVELGLTIFEDRRCHSCA